MAALAIGILALVAVPGVAGTFPDCVNGPLKNNTVCNTGAPAVSRAQALVAALTNAEKFNLTGNTSPGVPRLGLPSYQWWQEALHGVASSPGVNFSTSGNFSHATSFPQPILMSAAFDDALIHDVATVVSTEARAFNNFNRAGLDFWTPNINPYKDPRWGRGQETPGEDPFHLKSYVAQLIDGLQGGHDPPIKKIVATCKHFVAYDLEDWETADRYNFDAIVSTQDLAEYYIQPFQTCARDAAVGSIMCSYNALNGVPTCADPYILQDILREHWNWTGDGHYVTSDCDAIQNVFSPHYYTSTREQAVADTLIAGADLNCGTYYQTWLPEAYAEGLFNQSVIDQSLVRLYPALVKLGYFDPASATPYRSLGWSDVSTPAAEALTLKAAEEGIVLIKNNGALPLQLPKGRNTTIALFGSWANATTQMQGNYFGIAPYLHSPLYALQQLPNVTVQEAGGFGFPTTGSWETILAQANESDIIIVADGIDTSVESESMDRYTLDWAAGTLDLINQFATLGKPLIVLQMGDQLDNTPLLTNPNVDAIVWGGYPGMSGGDALVNILTGKAAPAGRLPVTQYPADYVTQVPMTDMSLRPNATSGNPGRTYIWYPDSVLPFGYGLHYTNFSVSAAPPGNTSYDISSLVSSCNKATYAYMDLCPFESYNVTVKNTGSVTSDFVTLGFISGQHGPQPYPIKQLVAYERLFNVTGGGSATASLNLTLGSLARRDENGNLVLYPGDYGLLIDVPTSATLNFTLTGSQAVLDQWPQRPAQG
ncbi:beta-glucosidase [Exophiala viscosa]|uniref:beta-glucosidase n=1 Tax=Exophiala viscosa TaxID=2486360 RepID=UPI00219A50C1|nr:beta-glucosidase [Exophiala viscosa]